MLRSTLRIATAVALLLPLTHAAQADHNFGRSSSYVQFGQDVWIDLGERDILRRGNIREFVPEIEFREPDNFASNDSTFYPEYDNAQAGDRRSRLLDRDLGRALEELRRDLSRRDTAPVYRPEPERRVVAPPAQPKPTTRPVERIDVTRLPDRNTQPTVIKPKSGTFVEEVEVLGKIDFQSFAEAEAAGITGETTQVQPTSGTETVTVGIAGARDVVDYGPDAFKPVENPAAMGLPVLENEQQYYALNGNIVKLDAAGQRALTMTALNQVLNR